MKSLLIFFCAVPALFAGSALCWAAPTPPVVSGGRLLCGPGLPGGSCTGLASQQAAE